MSLRDIKTSFQIARNRLLFQLVALRRVLYRRKRMRAFRGVASHEPFPYRYSAGRYASVFFEGLKQGKILASRCAACKTTLVPCRLACGNCFAEMRDIVELPGTGHLLSYTQVSFPFIDPFTGRNRPVPYCYAMIRMDGADNSFQGLLDVRYHHRLKSGMKVRAVFHEQRKGHVDDIKYFEVLG